MSRTKRILLAIGLFILIPAIYNLTLASVSSPQPNSPISIKSASPSPSRSSCLEIRQAKASIEEVEREQRKDALNSIYKRQREILLSKLESLHKRALISDEEWKNIESIIENADSDNLPLSPFEDEFLVAKETIESLLEKRYLPKYFDEQVISMGNNLANTPNQAFVFVLQNRECFDELDILMAESLINVSKVDAAWDDKQTATDFVQVLNRRNR
jgi:hypothetical protein